MLSVLNETQLILFLETLSFILLEHKLHWIFSNRGYEYGAKLVHTQNSASSFSVYLWEERNMLSSAGIHQSPRAAAAAAHQGQIHFIKAEHS